MSPTFTHARNGQVYRYYVSSSLQVGRPSQTSPASLRRVSAPEIEGLLRDQLAARLGEAPETDLSQLLAPVTRIEIEEAAVRIVLRRAKLSRTARAACETMDGDPTSMMLDLPLRCRIRGGRTRIIAPARVQPNERSKRDPVLIRGLRQGHRIAGAMGWRLGEPTPELLNAQAPASAYDRKLCRLAFLAPDIQRLILQGRQPIGTNLQMLMRVAIPTSWAEQRKLLGLLER